MYIIRGLKNVPPHLRGGAVTIGNFDGVHLGHQAVFATLRGLAARHDAPALAITFEPHPRRLLRPDEPLARITGVRGKARWMERNGLDAMLVLQFTHSFARITAEEFVRQVLVEGLAAREVLVGFNFRFGAGGRGEFELLEDLGRRYHFGAHQQMPFQVDGHTVSSTRIREAVWDSDFAAAATLLGRVFEIEGRVGAGRRRGRGLGFPTANLSLGDLLHPPAGVYVVEGKVEGRWLPGVANIGVNPTFGDEGLHLEVHLLAPCDDLYRQVIRVRFHQRLRGEVTFADAGALQRQIARDVADAKTYFATAGRGA